MKRIHKWMLLTDLLIVFIGLFLDRITKLWAQNSLKGNEQIDLIQGVLELRYLENRGAAFGILQNQMTFFIVTTSIVVILLLYVLFRMPAHGKYRLLHIAASIMLAGALGNFWDRVVYDYVVDFIYISLIDFPICNIADIYVSVTCFVGIIWVLLGQADDLDFSFLKTAKKKEED